MFQVLVVAGAQLRNAHLSLLFLLLEHAMTAPL